MDKRERVRQAIKEAWGHLESAELLDRLAAAAILATEEPEPPPSIIEEVAKAIQRAGWTYAQEYQHSEKERITEQAKAALRTLIKQGRESAEWGDYFFDTGSPYTLKKIDKYIRISLSLTETEFEELAE